eukprot:jgi/Chlat1/4334/Chrsp29S04500
MTRRWWRRRQALLRAATCCESWLSLAHPFPMAAVVAKVAVSAVAAIAGPAVVSGGKRSIRRAQSQSSRCWRRRSTCSISAPEHTNYISDVAAFTPPANLPALLRVLEAKGEKVVAPTERAGMVPLVIPLTRHSSGEVTGLLRWPTPPENLPMPVVRATDHGLQLLATSAETYIHRMLAEEDVNALESGVQQRLLAEAAGECGAQLYKSGDVAASRLKRLDVFFLKQVGMFPDVFERLTQGHLDKQDEVSALVTIEWYCRGHFPGWARPYAFNALTLNRVGRPLEARDAARVALRNPWWTLGTPFTEVADLAGYGESGIEFVREKLSEETKQNDIVQGKAPAQVALDQAAFMMDICSASNQWQDSIPKLAELYKEAGYPEVARFVEAAAH